MLRDTDHFDEIQCLRSCPFVLAAATITLLLDIIASQIHQNELITSY
jgi:hypothetical protein